MDVSLVAVRFGWPYYLAHLVVPRNSEIYTIGDLAGKTWGYGDPGSTSGYIVPSVELQAMGITPKVLVPEGVQKFVDWYREKLA